MMQTVINFFTSGVGGDALRWLGVAYIAAVAIHPRLQDAARRFSEHADRTSIEADNDVARAFSVGVQWMGIIVAIASALVGVFAPGWRRK